MYVDAEKLSRNAESLTSAQWKVRFKDNNDLSVEA